MRGPRERRALHRRDARRIWYRRGLRRLHGNLRDSRRALFQRDELRAAHVFVRSLLR